MVSHCYNNNKTSVCTISYIMMSESATHITLEAIIPMNIQVMTVIDNDFVQYH